MPAAGFALDLDRLTEALHAAGAPEQRPVRVVVVGPPHDSRVGELRSRGIVAVALQGREAVLTWARAWGFTHVLDASGWIDATSGAGTQPPFAERGER